MDKKGNLKCAEPIKITELQNFVINSANLSLSFLNYGTAFMMNLAQLLWVTDKKFRVTIECDPEAGTVKMERVERP